MKEEIIKLYELFFSRTSGNRNFIFNPSEAQLKTIDNFLILVDKLYGLNSVSSDFIFDYFSFAFSQRYDQKTRFGKGIVQFNHVIGKKQLKLWGNRGESWKYFADKYRDEFSITSINKIKIKRHGLNHCEENIKKTKYGTLEGLSNCIEFTTLYNPKSTVCRICSNSCECIEVLKKTLPNLHKQRFT